MAETIRIELTRKELEGGILPLNHVMVEMTHSNDFKKTDKGIIVGLPQRGTYANSNNALCADMQEVWGVVYKVPEKLFYDENSFDSMDWETDMEVQIGDLVWMALIDSANSHSIICEEKEYKIIPYQELYVAKRTDRVIPLNGYILCQTVNMKKISELDVTSEEKIDKTKAVVRFVGNPNKRYKTKGYVDHLNLMAGDEISLDKWPLLFLERKKEFASFDGDNLYIVVPRQKVSMVTKRNFNNSI